MVQVVIAARGGLRAKSRCADALNARDRARLVCVMLEDMLDAVARCAAVTQAWVTTPTAEIAEIAAGRGAKVVRQARPNGLNRALRQAAAEVSEQAPYAPILMLPGDLPLLEPDDLAAAALLVRTHAVVLASALDGGTGLLALRAGADLPPAFGPDSFWLHATAAEQRGLSVGLIATGSLSRDVDRPEDLLGVCETGPGSRTAAFLRKRLQPRIRS